MPWTRRQTFERRIETLIALFSASAILLAASCTQDDEDRSPPLVAGDAAAGSAPGVYHSSSDDGGVHRDTQVLMVLLTANEIEERRAKFAVANGEGVATRDLAASLATDHAAAIERLRDLGRRKAITPESSAKNTELEIEADDIMARLESRSGGAFDRAYLEGVITTNLKTMALFDHELTSVVVDPDLARAVDEARDEAVIHRERAQEIHRSLPRDVGPRDEASSTSYVDSSTPAVDAPDAGAPP